MPPSNPRPQRTCVGCRTKTDDVQLVRVVVIEGAVAVDHARRAPGRGAWLHPTAECLALALRKRAITRALKVSDADLTPVSSDPTFT